MPRFADKFPFPAEELEQGYNLLMKMPDGYARAHGHTRSFEETLYTPVTPNSYRTNFKQIKEIFGSEAWFHVMPVKDLRQMDDLWQSQLQVTKVIIYWQATSDKYLGNRVKSTSPAKLLSLCREYYTMYLINELQRRHYAAVKIQARMRGHNARWKIPMFTWAKDEWPVSSPSY